MALLKHTGPSSIYTELSEFPIPVSADVGDNAVHITYSVRDNERNIKRSITKTYSFNFDEYEDTLIYSTPHHDSSEIKACATSSSNKYKAILREITTGSTKKRFVEIWSGIQLQVSLDVSTYHDAFITDDFLSSLSFSPSETSLIYTAEANVIDGNDNDDGASDPYPKFRYTPHFGDPSPVKKTPAIFLLCWTLSVSSPYTRTPKKHMSFCALSPVPPAQVPILFAQSIFARDDTIFATGYEQTKDGRILGLRGCFNRPAGIWELKLPERATLEGISMNARVPCDALRLTPSDRSCRSPRVLLKYRKPIKLFWLSNPVGGAHASCTSLECRDLIAGSNKVLVDTVMDPMPENGFPGLYTEFNIPSSPFLRLNHGIYIVLQSIWQSRTTALFIDTESGAITDKTKMNDSRPTYSWNVLATDGRRHVVCSRSSLTTPSEVLFGCVDQQDELTWKIIDGLAPELTDDIDVQSMSLIAADALDNLTAFIIPISERHPTETLVIQSKAASTRPGPKPVCVTILHGGPHATSTTAFSPMIVALALEGYTISLPNYTGSLGFGEKYVRKLLGHCGTMDVQDVVDSVNELIRRGISEAGRQVVQGGSHGGFLCAHLIGQHPNLFNAAVMRNPVISVGEHVGTDIPDWTCAEFGLDFTPETLMTPAAFQKLNDASPIRHVDRVCAPVLLLLGEDDLRVVPTQGMRYYHALKGRDKRVEMLVFPKETHSLDGVEAARVSFEATRDWFKAFAIKADEQDSLKVVD